MVHFLNGSELKAERKEAQILLVNSFDCQGNPVPPHKKTLESTDQFKQQFDGSTALASSQMHSFGHDMRQGEQVLHPPMQLQERGIHDPSNGFQSRPIHQSEQENHLLDMQMLAQNQM